MQQLAESAPKQRHISVVQLICELTYLLVRRLHCDAHSTTSPSPSTSPKKAPIPGQHSQPITPHYLPPITVCPSTCRKPCSNDHPKPCPNPQPYPRGSSSFSSTFNCSTCVSSWLVGSEGGCFWKALPERLADPQPGPRPQVMGGCASG